MASDMLINKSGLVVNSFRDIEGRGAYFPGSAGTSEGQFLFVLGMLDAYKATGRAAARSLARRTLLPILPVLYRGAAVPSIALAGQVNSSFAPHWLFNAKYPFTSATVHLDRLFPFVNGVATIPAAENSPFRQAFTARSADSELLWENPFSALRVGTAYEVVSVSVNSQGDATVTVDQPISGQAYIAYSTVDGPVIGVDQPFEAWPDWRTLEAGEIACAVDVFVWAHKAFQGAFEALNTSTWRNAALATAGQGLVAFDVNDSRDWIKPSYSKSPFAQGSMFRYINRNPAPSFSADAQGRLTVTAQAGSLPGEIQVGNASRNDVYGANDQTEVVLALKMQGYAGALTVSVFIDPEQNYDEAKRYAAKIELFDTTTSGDVKTLLDRSSFKNPAGETIPANMPVYTVGVEVRDARAFILTVERIRQTPPRPTAYYPGAIPFTANFQGNPPKLIDWRGPLYMGYQSPKVWRTFGEELVPIRQAQLGRNLTTAEIAAIIADHEAKARTNVQLLADAQDQWTVQTGLDQVGPFAPVYYFNRSDAVQYGPPDTFGWEGPDPNTKWGGYQYRPLAELAELSGTGVSVAPGHAVARKFIDWLADDEVWLPVWPDALGEFNTSMVALVSFDLTASVDIPEGPALGPPTDFPQGKPEINYFEPHMAALILRSVIYLNGGNPYSMTWADRAVVNKCLSALQRSYTATGKMQGTFTSGAADADWYGFWHGEILTTLSKFIQFATSAGWFPEAQEATAWIDGMLLFAQANIEVENSPVTPTEPLDPQNPHPLPGYPSDPFQPGGERPLPGYPEQRGDPQEPDPQEFEEPMITNPVNWVSPVVEEIAFSTEIVTSESGREQRMANRAECRRSLTYRFLFRDGERQKMENMLRTFQNRTVLLPHWHLAQPIAHAFSGTMSVSSEIPFSETYKTGGEVMFSYLRRFFRAKISAVSGNTLLLSNPLGREWPAGTLIMPAFPALFGDQVAITHQTSLIAEGSLKFFLPAQTDGNVMPFFPTLGQVVNTFITTGKYGPEERELIDYPTHWKVKPNSSYSWDYIRVENKFGPTRTLATAERGVRQYDAQWQFSDLDGALLAMGILNRLKGRFRACWMPTGQNDLIPRSSSLGARMTVTANSFTRAPETPAGPQLNAPMRKPVILEKTTAVYLLLVDGTHRAARVIDVSTNGIESELTFDRTVNVEYSQIKRVSLMYRVRQASDSASISWLTNLKGQLNIQFATVDDDF